MKLKKTLAGALTLCLAMGAAGAMAENKMTGGDEPVKSAETTVQMTIDPTLDTYTITIPSSVTINPKNRQGTGDITLSNDGLELVSCRSLAVKLVAAENPIKADAIKADDVFQMKNAEGTLTEYAIQKEGTYSISEKRIALGDTVLSYMRTEKLTEPKTQKLIFYVSTLPTEGLYTDKLTFSVSFSGE